MLSRIALISEHASPLAHLGGVDSGGQNVYVAQLANHLVARGHQVDVFTRRDNEALPEAITCESGVRIVHVPAGPPEPVRKELLLPFMDEFTEGVQRFMAREGAEYDILHANFWTSGLVAAALKRASKIPFVITFHALGRVRKLHQQEADEFPAERPAHEEAIIAECDGVIAECPQDRDDLVKLYAAQPAKIAVIPCGFDAAEMWPVPKSEARAALGFDPDEKLLLQLGRLVPRKGIDVAVRALALLERKYKVVARLMVVGGESDEPDPRSTPEIGRLKEIAREEGVQDRVIFTGRRPRHTLRNYYSACDVFITTPWYEPFGITPVEAMACGTPVIGSSVGGIKTTVAHGRSGFLVPPRDPEAVAERLAYLYQNPAVMRAFGRAGAQRANQRYTWSLVAERAISLYKKVVTAEQRRASGEPK